MQERKVAYIVCMPIPGAPFMQDELIHLTVPAAFWETSWTKRQLINFGLSTEREVPIVGTAFLIPFRLKP